MGREPNVEPAALWTPIGWILYTAIAAGVLFLLLPEPLRWVQLGAMPLVAVWGVGESIGLRGAGRARRSATVGESTARLVEPLVEAGWGVVHQVDLGGHHVDHVLFGPGGVFAIESTAVAGLDSFDAGMLRRALKWELTKATGNALEVQSMLEDIGGGWVQPVLVVWGPGVADHDVASSLVSPVVVAAGLRSSEWLPDMIALGDNELVAPSEVLAERLGASRAIAPMAIPQG